MNYGIPRGKTIPIFETLLDELLTAHGQKRYEKGFIDGSHTTAQQANEIHDIELKEMYLKGREEVINYIKKLSTNKMCQICGKEKESDIANVCKKCFKEE